MEMTAATATARGGDDGGGDHNENNGAITMVINLDLPTTVVRRYVARLNLTGGMAVSLFFQGGNDGGGGGGGARGGGENENDNEDDAAPPSLMGTAWELVDVLCRGNYWRWVPLPPLRIRRRWGETTTSTANAAMRGGGRAGAATSRMTAIAEGGIRRGQTRPWRRRTTTTATAPPRARPIRRRRYDGDDHRI